MTTRTTVNAIKTTSPPIPAGSPAPLSASIAVVGAGPGGLTAARILQRHGLQVVVYDSDTGPDARDQGGSLDLRTEDGQRALTEAGLIDQFHELSRPEGQEMRQLDPGTGATFFHHVPGPDEQDKPEIDRAQLRTLLLESLVEGTVRWGAQVTAVDAGSGSAGPSTVHLADGSTARHDLVIGADGAFSRVRRTVSDAAPLHTGVTFLEAWFDEVADRHPWLDTLCGGGAAAAADGARGMFAQRSFGGHVRVYLMISGSSDELATLGLTSGSTEDVRAALLEQFRDWDPTFRRVITDNDGPFVTRPIWALPAGHRWEHSPSLTLLGDAAHVMPPVGVGVNLAMLDACELALALVEQPTVDAALRRYEPAMWERSAEVAAQAHEMLALLIHGAPPPSDDNA